MLTVSEGAVIAWIAVTTMALVKLVTQASRVVRLRCMEETRFVSGVASPSGAIWRGGSNGWEEEGPYELLRLLGKRSRGGRAGGPRGQALPL